jgi:hypothetical protein
VTEQVPIYPKDYGMDNTNIAICIEDAIKIRTKELLDRGEIPPLPDDLIATDNLGEVIEKLCILHVRTWFLEDMVGVATTDEQVASLKRKIDTCFKQKRPQYIQAINRMVDAAIVGQRSLIEDSVKIYRGN